MGEEGTTNQELKPLKITCTSSDCTNDLHCFLATQKLVAEGRAGRCRSCGADLVDWRRVHRRNLSDVRYTFDALRFELIRHHFWHIPLTQRAVNHARRKGRVALQAFATRQLRVLVGSERHVREGYQTARETSPGANAIHYAQHATASCCRKCIAEWHGIPGDRPLTGGELKYFTDLAMLYVADRLPTLADDGTRISPIRTEAGAKQNQRLDRGQDESGDAD